MPRKIRVPQSDIDYLKTVTHLLLTNVESALQHRSSRSEETEKFRQKLHGRIFGSKVSLAKTLVMAVELMLRLNKEGRLTGATKNDAGQPLSTSDLALVE